MLIEEADGLCVSHANLDFAAENETITPATGSATEIKTFPADGREGRPFLRSVCARVCVCGELEKTTAQL